MNKTGFAREGVDLSTESFVCGNMGRLMPAYVWPVEAGSSLEVTYNAGFQLSPLQYGLILDPQVDIVSCFMPHRWFYEDDDITFVDLVKQGAVEQAGGTPLTLENENLSAATPCYFLPGRETGASPKYLLHGYNLAWNGLFRIRNVEDPIPLTTQPGTQDSNYQNFGRHCAKLPRYWNTGIPESRYDADQYQSVAVQGSGTYFDLTDFAKVIGEFKDQIQRDWFDRHYEDLLKGTYGVRNVNNEADQDSKLPWLLNHDTFYLSGRQVDGTDTQSLGEQVGRSSGFFQHRIPSFFAPEPGCIWTFYLLRFPPIWETENHYLFTHTNDYKNLMGDPRILMEEPPHILTRGDFTGYGEAGNLGVFPYGNWHRWAPPRVHYKLRSLTGMPFQTSSDLDPAQNEQYYDYQFRGDDNDFFDGTTRGHWQAQTEIHAWKKSVVPSASHSVYAGTNH
jgi:hypothetical protein